LPERSGRSQPHPLTQRESEVLNTLATMPEWSKATILGVRVEHRPEGLHQALGAGAFMVATPAGRRDTSPSNRQNVAIGGESTPAILKAP
jgi:hypothetical protein